MYKEFKTYTIICDRCGKDSNEDCDYSGRNDMGYVLECAQEDNWMETDFDTHYCPDC
jgi:hypothetical protein